MEKNRSLKLDQLLMYLQEKKITQEQLSEDLGMVQSNVSAILNGFRNMKCDTLFYICKKYDIPLSSIVADEYRNIIK